MSQATLSDRPYVEPNLFSGHYLDERLRERDEWDCDDAASEALSELQALYDAEGELLSEYKEAALVEAFVPVAIDEAGGFANFRETATKTNSLLGRLATLTLPGPDDVADRLKRYIEAKEGGEESDDKIEPADELINGFVKMELWNGSRKPTSARGSLN